MIVRLIAILALAGAMIGCGEKLEVTNNPETPKPTQEQLANMPPQAAEHASKMSDYSKAMAEQNKSRAPR